MRVDVDGALTLRAMAEGDAPAIAGSIFFDTLDSKLKITPDGASYVEILTDTGAAPITGGGAAGYLPRFSGATSIAPITTAEESESRPKAAI